MVTEKHIILCADDYGLTNGISQGIRQLVAKQCLTAVSCMVNTADLALQAKQLLKLGADIDIGLHFNLTEGYFLTAQYKPMPKLPILLLKSHLRLLSEKFIEAELTAQLNRFEQAFGKSPDFIDGHQHVHHLPQIRNVVLKVYKQRLQTQGCYLRSVYPMLKQSEYRLKSGILTLTGGYQFKQLLQQQGILHNTYFSGIYDFSPQTNYAELMSGLLAQAPTGTLVMCHPGLVPDDANDGIAHARSQEYAYLASQNFKQDCQRYQVKLSRWPAQTNYVI